MDPIERHFRTRIEAALVEAQKILDTTRALVPPSDAPHEYSDKFGLVERSATTTLSAQLALLARGTGRWTEHLPTLLKWSAENRKVTLRFTSATSCVFARTETRTEESGSIVTERASSLFGGTSKTTTKVVTKITEHFWTFTHNWALIAYVGGDPTIASCARTLSEGTAFHEMKTQGGQADSTLPPLHTQGGVPTCPQSHKLTRFRTPRGGFACDGCAMQGIPVRTAMHGCRPCDYDLCEKCCSRGSAAKAPISGNTQQFETSLCWVLERITTSNGGGDDKAKAIVRMGSYAHAIEPTSLPSTPLLPPVTFRIDRDASSCRTPKVNAEVHAMTVWLASMRDFWTQVSQRIAEVCASENLPVHLSHVTKRFAEELFHINAASFSLEDEKASSSGVVVAAAVDAGAAIVFDAIPVTGGDRDAETFLLHYQRTFDRLLVEHADTYTRAEEARIASLATASLGVICDALQVVDTVERMLTSQIIAAVGKSLSATDFKDYMEFHNRRLFAEAYRPRPFAFAVRRTGCAPCGILTIEESSGLPIKTMVLEQSASKASGVVPMTFPLSAATDIELYGSRYLHATVLQSFDGGPAKLGLIARARQFGSFILMVGKLSAADAFDPIAVLVVSNKDEVILPLVLSTVPSPKEFRDAIESLSPEQQAFCKAYRGMQLASSVFAVAVIQVQPQLELVLNLDSGALTKEIALNRKLMEFFTKYQVSADLLSFDPLSDAGGATATPQQKIDAVRAHSLRLQGVIDAERATELAEAKQAAEKELALELARVRLVQDDNDWLMDSLDEDEWHSECLASLSSFGKMQKTSLIGDNSAQLSASAKSVAYSRQDAARATETAEVMVEVDIDVDTAAQSGDGDEATKTSATTAADGTSGGAAVAAQESIDFTAIPKELDRCASAMDVSSSLRATIIKTGEVWIKNSQAVRFLITHLISPTSSHHSPFRFCAGPDREQIFQAHGESGSRGARKRAQRCFRSHRCAHALRRACDSRHRAARRDCVDALLQALAHANAGP